MGDMEGDDLEGTINNDTDSSDEEEVDNLSISYLIGIRDMQIIWRAVIAKEVFV